MLVTLEVCHCERSPSNDVAVLNMYPMLLTLEVWPLREVAVE